MAPGTTVQWINDDSVAHTVTADGGAFDSGSLAPGATFSFTFSQAGDFPYYCHFHGGPGGQGMSSRVTVTSQSGAAGQNGAPQGYTGSMTMPGGNNYQAPSYGNTYRTPGYSNTYRSPTYGNMYKAPAYGNYGHAYRAPSYSNTYRAPSYGNTYRVPSYANRYAAPQCHSSYSSGYSASRYGSASAYSHYLPMPYGHRMGMPSYGY